jgi:hypothetical protein
MALARDHVFDLRQQIKFPKLTLLLRLKFRLKCWRSQHAFFALQKQALTLDIHGTYSHPKIFRYYSLLCKEITHTPHLTKYTWNFFCTKSQKYKTTYYRHVSPHAQALFFRIRTGCSFQAFHMRPHPHYIPDFETFCPMCSTELTCNIYHHWLTNCTSPFPNGRDLYPLFNSSVTPLLLRNTFTNYCDYSSFLDAIFPFSLLPNRSSGPQLPPLQDCNHHISTLPQHEGSLSESSV